MSKCEKSSRFRLLRAIGNRVSRMRHFRGHGVHSPYIYRIAREVFLTRKLFERGDGLLYNSLNNECGLSDRDRIELQNIYTLYSFESFAIDTCDAAFVIFTTKASLEEIEGGVREAKRCGITIAILAPCYDNYREVLCERIIAEHYSTTLQRSNYLLIFNNHLPKQHFQL